MSVNSRTKEAALGINDQIRLSRLGSLNTCHSLMGVFFNLRTVKIANFAAEKQDENRTI